MNIHNFAESNSIVNHYMAELRDKNYQKNRLTFRHNVERIGEIMAYELSKTLEYKPKTVKTPLGTLDIPLTCLSTRGSSMCSMEPTMLLCLLIVCILTVNILKWVSMLSILLHLALKAGH